MTLLAWVWQWRKARTRHLLASELPPGGVGVEVGTWKGEHAWTLLEMARPRQLFLVDPYKVGDEGREWWAIALDRLDKMYLKVVRDFRKNDNVFVVRQSSPEAVAFVPDKLDWVYIDGDHRAPSVHADLEAWWPRIKPGGRMYGDDFIESSWWGDDVTRTVRAFAAAHELRLRVVFNQWIIDKPVAE